MAFAELHCHTNFSFLDGASSADELVDRAVALGLSGLAVTDHQGLYGVVRFSAAAREAGLHPVIGIELELLDAFAPDPDRIVVPDRRAARRGGGRPAAGSAVGSAVGSAAGWAVGSAAGWAVGSSAGPAVFGGRLGVVVPSGSTVAEGLPVRPRPDRRRLPGHRDPVKEDLRGIGDGQRGPHLVLLARDPTGYRSLCRLVSRANLAGTKGVPRFTQALLADHAEGLVALSGCRDGEIARRLRVGDRAGARVVAEGYARLFGSIGGLGSRVGSAGSADSAAGQDPGSGSPAGLGSGGRPRLRRSASGIATFRRRRTRRSIRC
jgi:error-prone DNA polymerase